MPAFELAPADGQALDRILAVRPRWHSMARAKDAIGLDPATLLHAGPPFASVGDICRPIMTSACLAAVFEGLAGDPDQAEAAIMAGEITLRPAQDRGVVMPLAAVLSASMWLQVVRDGGNPQHLTYAPLNGGNGPAPRLGLRSDDALVHLRWVNGPFQESLAQAFAKCGGEAGLDLIELAAKGLAQGDDGHGRTGAATAALVAALSDGLPKGSDARRFLEQGPSFFLNLWMAACKNILAAAEGQAGSSLITAAGGNGVTTGIQVAGQPKRWFTAPADPPHGDLGGLGPERALGAIGDSAIVDMAGFGAMALSYAPAQQEALGAFAPADAQELPGRLFPRPHPGFGDLGLLMGLCAARVVEAGRAPIVSLGILDRTGAAGRLGGGIFTCPLAVFEEAAAAAGA